MTTKVHFLPEDIIVEAESGEPILDVAARAGVEIATGCLMGSCHACEVELDDEISVCACISSIPSDRYKVTITVYDDPEW